MESLIVNYLCLFVLYTTTLANGKFNNTDSFRGESESEKHIVQMLKNLSEIPFGDENIESLNIAYNQMSSLEEKAIIKKGYRMVKRIYINNNNIVNVSVSAFAHLPKLQLLDLSDNNITSIDPYTFNKNGNLQTIKFMNNKISFDRLQTFIISHSVTTIILSNNMITEIYGVTFLGVPNLKRLFLSDNTLQNLDPNSFKSLSKLQYLSLANTGVLKLSESMFIKIPKIINLENTPLGNKFKPPLRQVVNVGVINLLKYHF